MTLVTLAFLVAALVTLSVALATRLRPALATLGVLTKDGEASVRRVRRRS